MFLGREQFNCLAPTDHKSVLTRTYTYYDLRKVTFYLGLALHDVISKPFRHFRSRKMVFAQTTCGPLLLFKMSTQKVTLSATVLLRRPVYFQLATIAASYSRYLYKMLKYNVFNT